MATKTFEELKQLAVQIRDEKTNKQNTATRIGTQMLEHLNKLEQDYYDKTATDKELKQRDEKLSELASGIVIRQLSKSITENNQMLHFLIPTVVGTKFVAKIESSDIANATKITSYIVDTNSSVGTNYRSLPVTNKGKYWEVTGDYNSDDLNGNRKYFRVFFNTVTAPLDVTVTLQTIQPNVVTESELQNKIGINVTNSIYENSDVGNLDYQEIGVTDYSHIILYGQSLSQGFQSPRVITTEPVAGNYMVGNAPYYGYDNNNATQLNPLKAVKYNSIGEEPIVALTNSFSKLYRRFVNKNQLFIGSNPSQDGRSIEKLSKECTNGTTQENNLYMQRFYKLLTDTKSIVDEQGKSISCSAILYMQGEYNYTNLDGNGLTDGTDATNDKDTYKSLLLTLKNNMQSDVIAVYGQDKKPLFFIYQVAGSYINNKQMTINMAQIEFALENDDVFLLNSTYFAPDYGGGHLSTNGYRWYGEQMSKALYDVFIKGVDCKPVFPMSYNVSGNNVIIECYAPVLPLSIDTFTKESITNYGFRVFCDNTEVSINEVSIKNNAIIITCAKELTGTIEITYAGQGRNGSGNIRDNDNFHSLYTYFDDSSDTLKENYTPQDQNGNKIYGEYYPMYNWLVAFYKKIAP